MSAAFKETKGSAYYDYCPAAYHKIFLIWKGIMSFHSAYPEIDLIAVLRISGLKWAIVFSLWEHICASVLEDKTSEEMNNVCYPRDHILIICSASFFLFLTRLVPPALVLQCGFFDRARPPKDDDVSDREQLTAEKSTDAWEQNRWQVRIKRSWDNESPWGEWRSCGRRFRYLCRRLQIRACK